MIGRDLRPPAGLRLARGEPGAPAAGWYRYLRPDKAPPDAGRQIGRNQSLVSNPTMQVQNSS
ncbi:hypothetical protein TUM12370_12330 [Salmonella enterica subsp. enterica serovar Choleraesuis]|nr:hypothetical protein TUM12370_12330 [Salmonella enterica subsp. enterica serovar Choleraesuis]